MNSWTQIGAPMLAAFLASLVECVEALTVVLAIASLRGWRSALWGVAAAFLGLCCLGLLGQRLTLLPVSLAQLLIGALLLLFGLRWLRKAILRSAGVIALHDEGAAYAQAQARLRGVAPAQAQGVDPIAFWGSFKIVLLEGVEVIFIIIAIASKDHSLWPACTGALAALLLVLALGALLRRPLARIPENSVKFAVGLLLVALGSFWLGEGLLLEWPGGDWSVLGLLAFYALLAQALVRSCRLAAATLRATKQAARSPGTASAVQGSAPQAPAPPAPAPGPLRVAIDELIGLFIDDRWLAYGVIAWVLLWWLALKSSEFALGAWQASLLFTAGLGSLLSISAWRAATIR